MHESTLSMAVLICLIVQFVAMFFMTNYLYGMIPFWVLWPTMAVNILMVLATIWIKAIRELHIAVHVVMVLIFTACLALLLAAV